GLAFDKIVVIEPGLLDQSPVLAGTVEAKALLLGNISRIPIFRLLPGAKHFHAIGNLGNPLATLIEPEGDKRQGADLGIAVIVLAGHPGAGIKRVAAEHRPRHCSLVETEEIPTTVESP